MKQTHLSRTVIAVILILVAPLLLIITMLCTDETVHAVEHVSASTTTDLQTAIDTATEQTDITLTQDFALDRAVHVPAGADIILSTANNHSVTLTVAGAFSGDRSMLIVDADGQCLLDGDITFDAANLTRSNRPAIAIEGRLVMNDGCIENYSSTDARVGAVRINGNDASFEMNGGTISHNHINNQYCGTVLIRNGAHFEMNDGAITQNEQDDTNSAGGVMVYTCDTGAGLGSSMVSSFVMNGGEISHNSAPTGAGVYLFGADPYAYDYSSRATFEMNGGSITDNHATSANQGGGGVFVLRSGLFTMNAGRIADNVTEGMGGGVATYDQYVTFYGKSDVYNPPEWAEWYPAAFTLNGGTICGNTAHYTGNASTDRGCGGGVYVASNNVVLNAGHITGNTAGMQGGGVYVGSVPYKLHIYNALISENGAEQGGGVWFCPTGTADLYITRGAAVYGNTVAAFADDFNSESKSIGADSDYFATLSDRMLGGGLNNWRADESGNRFSIETTENLLPSLVHFTDDVAAKNVAATDAQDLAASKAQLFITGNMAGGHGGGLGSNGSVQIGDDVPTKTLTVTKQWVAEPGQTILYPQQLVVTLVIGGHHLDSIVLTEENNWTGHFTGLPADIELDELTVEETPIGGFTALYDPAQMDGDDIHIRITNTADAPSTETTPPAPSDDPTRTPDVPVTPVTPNTPDTDKPQVDPPIKPQPQPKQPQPEKHTAKLPKTGERNRAYVLLLIVVAAVMVYAEYDRRQRAKKGQQQRDEAGSHQG